MRTKIRAAATVMAGIGLAAATTLGSAVTPSAMAAPPADCTALVGTWSDFQSAYQASANAVICLTANISENGTPTARLLDGANVTVDLDGYGLQLRQDPTATAAVLGVPDTATLTLRDSAGTGPAGLLNISSDIRTAIGGGP
ncbi:MAG: hypothetical protein ACK5KU_04675, partial [Beutenbergiaceae bacterium]